MSDEPAVQRWHGYNGQGKPHEPPHRHAIGEAQPWEWQTARQEVEVPTSTVLAWQQWRPADTPTDVALGQAIAVFVQREHVRFFELRLGLIFRHWRLLNRCGEGTSRQVVRYQGE